MSRGKRGPHKRYLSNPEYPVPRQTRYNWRHAAAADSGAELDDSRVPDSVLCSSLPEISTSNPELTDSNTAVTDLEGDGATASNSDEPDFEIGSDPAPSPSHSLSPTHLCDGVQISSEVGLKLIMSLVVKHKLTTSALADILKVINMHLPIDYVPSPYKSVYRLLKYMASLESNLTSSKIVHKLCGKCGDYLTSNATCQNASCLEVIEQIEDSLFLELPVDIHIQALFQSE